MGMFTTFLRYKLEEWGEKHHVGQKLIPDAIMPRLYQYNKRKSCIHGDGPLTLGNAKKVYKIRCQME